MLRTTEYLGEQCVNVWGGFKHVSGSLDPMGDPAAQLSQAAASACVGTKGFW